jgi:Flp pilus assembly protein TadG
VNADPVGTANGLRRLRVDEEGQLLPLILVYTLIAAVLVGIVVDTSRTFLHRRSLAAAADAAATTGANALDVEEFYARAGEGEQLPLGATHVESTVQTYVADAGLAGRFEQLTAATRTDGETVTVTLTARVSLPFDVFSLARGGAPVEVTASARSPYLP